MISVYYSVVTFEPTPRGPLKRKKKSSEKPIPVAAVKRSGDLINGVEDEGGIINLLWTWWTIKWWIYVRWCQIETVISSVKESPKKKSRLESVGDVGGSGDEEMDVQESRHLEKVEHLEMDGDEHSSHGSHEPTMHRG